MMQNVHELGLDYTLSKLYSLFLDELNLSDDVMGKVCDCIKDSDLFSASHKGPLRTTYARGQTFKRMFKYVVPKAVRLGYDENVRQRIAYYIPVKQTLIRLLESELWKNSTDACVLSDICDGQVFKSNQFFIANPGGLKLILYQDAFEVVNPLGLAKKAHRVLAVYLSVANLPVHVWSNTDLMSLVLLCGEDDLKHFGCAKVFADMLLDVKDFEENGVTVGGETVQGALYCIAGPMALAGLLKTLVILVIFAGTVRSPETNLRKTQILADSNGPLIPMMLLSPLCLRRAQKSKEQN